MRTASHAVSSQHDAEDLEVVASELSPPLTPESTTVTPSQDAPDAQPELSPPPWAVKLQFNSKTKMTVPKGSLREMIPSIGMPSIAAGTADGSTSRRQIWQRVREVYRYTRIGSDKVRLLVIERGAHGDDVSVMLLTVHRKLLGKDYPYIALSYHWGGGDVDNVVVVQNELEIKETGRFDDLVQSLHSERPKKLAVRANLYAALKHLRRENEEVTIWVDALCINQNDMTEKSEQISQMPNIYRGAYNVCIWLGSDEGSDSTSAMAMKFIPLVIDPYDHDQLLKDDKMIPNWASLFELLEWSWSVTLNTRRLSFTDHIVFRFSRRWIIQEVALAKEATVHCGSNPEISWKDFQDAIAAFCHGFSVLRPRLIRYFALKYPRRARWRGQPNFEIEQLGAKLLVDITTDLYRENDNEDGSPQSTYGLESLVCQLSSFDTSDPRDTVNALINISSEYHCNEPGSALALPAPDYTKSPFQVYRDFVKWVVTTSNSLDIICRYWALPSREQGSRLPSWIKSAKDSAFGTGYDVFEGRKAGESLVGLPNTNSYHASGRGCKQTQPIVTWDVDIPSLANKKTQDLLSMSITATGLAIGTISSSSEPFIEGCVSKCCLEGLGWVFGKSSEEIVAEMPQQLWQTLVANRGPKGMPKPTLYRHSCQYVMNYLTHGGNIKIDNLLSSDSVAGYVKEYLERVRAVTWGRLFFQAKRLRSQLDASPPSKNTPRKLVGLGPKGTKDGDVIAILYGCSVPVILHPVSDDGGGLIGYRLIGEAFVYGMMDGEAVDGGYKEGQFPLI